MDGMPITNLLIDRVAEHVAICMPSPADAMPGPGSVDGSTSKITSGLIPSMAGERRGWYIGMACRPPVNRLGGMKRNHGVIGWMT